MHMNMCIYNLMKSKCYKRFKYMYVCMYVCMYVYVCVYRIRDLNELKSI